jgi:hypothetical protein
MAGDPDAVPMIVELAATAAACARVHLPPHAAVSLHGVLEGLGGGSLREPAASCPELLPVVLAALALLLPAVVLLVRVVRGGDSSGGGQGGAAARGDVACELARGRRSRPPERNWEEGPTSDEDGSESEEEGGGEASGGDSSPGPRRRSCKEGAEREEEQKRELLSRRARVMAGRPERVAKALAELERLQGSRDIEEVGQALKCHAGAPGETREAWLALQQHMRALVSAGGAETSSMTATPTQQPGASLKETQGLEQRNPAGIDPSGPP